MNKFDKTLLNHKKSKLNETPRLPLSRSISLFFVQNK